jgi:hypothetical protein
MKTFEDALGTVVVKGKGMKQLREKAPALSDVAGRYEDLAAQISANADVQHMADRLAESLCCERHAMIAIFINGVIVGMEMEKAE